MIKKRYGTLGSYCTLRSDIFWKTTLVVRLGGACNSVVFVCCFVKYLFFLICLYINKDVTFTFVISGPFIADYVVWALLIVEGRTVTYSC